MKDINEMVIVFDYLNFHVWRPCLHHNMTAAKQHISIVNRIEAHSQCKWLVFNVDRFLEYIKQPYHARVLSSTEYVSALKLIYQSRIYNYQDHKELKSKIDECMDSWYYMDNVMLKSDEYPDW